VSDAPPVRPFRSPADQPGSPAGPSQAVARLGPLARGWRVAVAAALAGGYLAGSLVGQDSWWPFGPWRMFATSTAPTGDVTVLALQVAAAADPAWRDSALTPADIGLNRAEVEGRQVELAADPRILRTLASAHARLHPRDPAWTGIRLVRRATVLRDGRPTGELRESVLVQWTAEAGARLGDR